MRRTLRESADIAVAGVRDEVEKPPPEKAGPSRRFGHRRKSAPVRPRSTGLRADIAQATKASLTKGSEKNGGQVSIVTSNSRLQPRHKGMAKAYNANRFRHPVFGGPGWADQRGQANYFRRGVAGRRDEMMRRLQAAMDDVTKNL